MLSVPDDIKVLTKTPLFTFVDAAGDPDSTGASLTELTMIVAVLDCVENAVVPPVVAALAVAPCVPVDWSQAL
jgi:hypothetical protein